MPNYCCSGLIRETGIPTRIAVTAENEEAAIKAANARGVIVESAKMDDTMIWCPYCFTVLPSNVQLLGQMVTCPQCHAQVQMPDTTGKTTNAAMFNMVIAGVGMLVAFILILRGCALSRLADSL